MYCRNQYLQIPVESSYYGNQRNMPKCLINYLATPGRGGGGTLDIKWYGWLNGGKNQHPKKPKKIPGPKFNPPKIPCWIYEAIKMFLQNYVSGICGNYHKIFRLFWIHKKSLRKSSYLKNTFQNFPTQKNPSIIPAIWNLEYPPPPHPPGICTCCLSE